MSTARRLYFYSFSLISLTVVVWGVIGLLRTGISGSQSSENSLLATGLSLVLVGAPVFWLHWSTIQREAVADPVERASRIRAVFLYGAFVAFLFPLIFSILALLDRGLVVLLGQPESRAWFGANQTLVDNFLAVLVNGVALVFCWSVLRKEWLANLSESFLPEARRFYRYFGVLAGLAMTVAGVYNLLRYLVSAPGQSSQQLALAGGICFLLVGVPLWGYHWWAVQDSLVDPAERHSLLRLWVLYGISLVGVVGVITTLGSVVHSLVIWIYGRPQGLSEFLQANAGSISAVVPMGAMWAYYGQLLSREAAVFPDQRRRSALHRLFFYFLCLLGLAVTFVGLYNLVDSLMRQVFSGKLLPGSPDAILRGGFSALLAGIPLWLIAWRSMQAEAARRDNLGDQSRRSVLRKSYLYLAIFLFAAGLIGFSGQLVFALLNALLSQDVPADLSEHLAQLILRLILALAFLAYHWRTLRRDNRLAHQTLGELHAGFPTLLLGQGDLFDELFLQELHRTAPRLPVAFQSIEQGAPDEAMLGAKLVLMPVGLALDPPESLRLWLDEYRGQLLLIPLEKQGYLLLGQGEKTHQELAQESTRAVRQMAEGGSLNPAFPEGSWAIAGTILGGLFILELVGILFYIMISSLLR